MGSEEEEEGVAVDEEEEGVVEEVVEEVKCDCKIAMRLCCDVFDVSMMIYLRKSLGVKSSVLQHLFDHKIQLHLRTII